MLKALFKKQLSELFRNLFRPGRSKSGKASAKKGIAVAVITLLLFGYLGAMFGFMANSLAPLLSVGLDWLFFLIFTGVALFLGVFGSVFNTFSSLYQAKDNDLLLSMPIPTRMILFTRLFGVYFMGLLFVAIVYVPAVVIYLIKAAPSFINGLGSALFILPLSFFVLALSCALGWVIAKIHAKLRRKSLVTVLSAIVFIGVYYFLFFKAESLISDILKNGLYYASEIKGAVYPVYYIGRAASGEWIPLLAVSAAVAVLFAAICLLLSRGFIKNATSGGVQSKKKNVSGGEKAKGADSALFIKELRRFTASATYMLNCGLGTLFMSAAGVFVLIKGNDLLSAFNGRLGEGSIVTLACAALCMMVSTNTITTPSISLEGKSIWILQSLPVDARAIIRAKLKLHLLLTEIPAVFCAICVMIVLRPGVFECVMLILLPTVFCFFNAVLGLYVNLKRPNLNWTTEAAVVKQNLNMFLLMMGNVALMIAYAVLWFVLDFKFLTAPVYMTIWLVIFITAALLFLRKLIKNGPALFYSL